MFQEAQTFLLKGMPDVDPIWIFASCFFDLKKHVFAQIIVGMILAFCNFWNVSK